MLITVKSGPNSVPHSVPEGTNIAGVRATLSKHLGLDADFQAWIKVDGEKPVLVSPEAEATTLVTEGATVEFVKPAGQKG